MKSRVSRPVRRYRCIGYNNRYHLCRCPACVEKRKARRLAEQKRAQIERERWKRREARRRKIENAKRKAELARLKKSKAPYIAVFEAGVREMRTAFNRKLNKLFGARRN